MIELSTKYAGVTLKNPLIVGSGPTTDKPEICAKAAKAGWAAVVLKTNWANDTWRPGIMDKICRPQYALADTSGIERFRPRPPKRTDSRSRGGRKLGRVPPDYAFLMSAPVTKEGPKAFGSTFFLGYDKYLGYINRTKEMVAATDCKVIASIYAFTEKGWEDSCEMVNRSDADMVELNFGCAEAGAIHPQTGEWQGVGAGMYPELVEKWTKFCAERLNKPFATKLPPHCPDLVASAKAAQENRSQGIQYADGDIFRHYPIRPVMLDPDTLQVGIFPGMPWATVSIGRVSLPYIMGGVTLMRRRGISIDISGCGGVRDYLDILRLLMCGATSVQVCTATVVEGVEVGAEYLEALTSWMEKKKYNRVKDIIGIVKGDMLRVDPSKWGPIETPQIMGGPLPSLMVEVNEKRCIQCGWCEQCCFNLAITLGGDKPIIDQKLCEICGMCVALCPMQALTIVPRK